MQVDAPDIPDTADIADTTNPRSLARAALTALHRTLLRALAAADERAPSDDADEVPSADEAAATPTGR